MKYGEYYFVEDFSLFVIYLGIVCCIGLKLCNIAITNLIYYCK